MSLFDGIPLEAYDTPAPPIRQLPPCLVTLRHASNGSEILLCSVTPPPAEVVADAKQRNLPLFTLDEIPAMRKAAADDPRYIDNLIAARRIFGWGGSTTHQMETA